MRYTIFDFDNLGGGVNDRFSPNAIANTEKPNTVRNIRLDGNDIVQRKGYITLGNIGGASGTDFAIRLMEPINSSSSANDGILIIDDSSEERRFVPDTLSFTVITGTTIAVTNVMNSAQYRDYFFVFNGANQIYVIDTSTLICSQPAIKPDSIASAANFTPLCGDVYLNSLNVGGVPIAPNTLFISKPASTGTPTAVYNFSGSIGSYGDAQEVLLPTRIVAIRRLPGFIVIFTNTSAFYYSSFVGNPLLPDIQQIPNATGAISQRACVVTDNDLLYLSDDLTIRSVKRQIQNSSGAQYLLSDQISLKVNKFLEKNCSRDQSRAFGYYNSREKIAYFYLKALDPEQFCYRIVLDYKYLDSAGNPAIFIDSNVNFSAGCYYKGANYTGSPFLWTLGGTSSVYLDGVGIADEDDAPINARWATKDFDQDDPRRLKRFYGVSVIGEVAGSFTMTISIYVDDVLVKTQDIVSSGANSDVPAVYAGVGSLPVASGVSKEGLIQNGDRQSFVETISFKATGRKISVVGTVSSADANWMVERVGISYMPLRKGLTTQADST